MSQLAPRLRFYIWCVIIAGAASVPLALARASHDFDRGQLALSGVVGGLALVAYLAPLLLPSTRQLLLQTAMQTIALLVLTPGVAGLVVGLSVVAGNVFHGRRWYNTLFNTAQVM